MIAVVIPIIVTYLVNNMNVPTAASFIDALFPAIVIYIQNKLKKSMSIIKLYCARDVIIDIYEGNYEKNETNYKTKWDDIEKILQKAGLA